MSESAKTEKLSGKNIIGYALGDTGGVLAFGVISTFLNVYYTDVFGIDPAKLTILFLVARLWDAINDPMMGAFVDSRKPNPSVACTRFAHPIIAYALGLSRKTMPRIIPHPRYRLEHPHLYKIAEHLECIALT